MNSIFHLTFIKLVQKFAVKLLKNFRLKNRGTESLHEKIDFTQRYYKKGVQLNKFPNNDIM